MKQRLARISCVFAFAFLAAPVLAQDLAGTTWLRETGASRVKFAPCGEALCGSIVWLKDPNGPAKLGQQVFFDMKPDGAGQWAGQAFNPEDGKTYSGKMTLSGATLTTAGCVFGGLICKSTNWSKAN
ncbi:MAG: DUF2147 domain-containing protein [Beijerinckiaceae bacterium]|nr:DUF2147 domain-containing protein [Beijerinckiaceae bacterium]